MRPMKAVLALTLLLGLMVMLAACEESKRAPQPMGSGVALMMVDYQRDFLQADGRMPIAQDQTAAVIKAANVLIAAARAHLIPVIYIKDEFTPWVLIGNMSRDFAAMRYQPGAELDPRIDGTAGMYFAKEHASAFSNSAVEPQLKQLGCGHIVIAGVYADRSVMRTARDAIERGYSVTVISDAVGAASDEARDAALKDLKAAGAEVKTSDEFISGLSAGGDNKRG
jgi:nicotinamidase-related amidase